MLTGKDRSANATPAVMVKRMLRCRFDTRRITSSPSGDGKAYRAWCINYFLDVVVYLTDKDFPDKTDLTGTINL